MGQNMGCKGYKDVKILSIEDKKRIKCIMSSSASGEHLPIQAKQSDEKLNAKVNMVDRLMVCAQKF